MRVLLASAVFLFIGCAHLKSQSRDPAELFASACGPGSQVSSVKGSIWLKATSKEASGQFPAVVNAQAPDHLQMEVTNLIGSPEALISIDGQKYTIKVPKKKVRTEEGTGSWGGIPLHWATELFLGRIPCPPKGEKHPALVVREQGELEIQTEASLGGAAELYVFRFRKWGGAPWPEALHWERKGPLGATVDFKFDDPDDATGSPRKWEAVSPQGEVKVRWKDREAASSAMR